MSNPYFIRERTLMHSNNNIQMYTTLLLLLNILLLLLLYLHAMFIYPNIYNNQRRIHYI